MHISSTSIPSSKSTLLHNLKLSAAEISTLFLTASCSTSRCLMIFISRRLRVYCMASVLDPCFKLDYVDSEVVPELKELLLSEGEEIGREATRSATSSIVPLSTEPPPKRRNLGSLFKEKEDHDNLPILSPAQRINAEMQIYLNRPKLDLEDELLLWWKHHATEFLILAKLVRKYLCVCATSAASERLFSMSGNIVTPRRSCLKPDKVNMLVFLANNL